MTNQCIVILFTQLAFVTKVHAEKTKERLVGASKQPPFDQITMERFVDKLVDRALKVWHLHHVDLENVVLGSPGLFVTPAGARLGMSGGISSIRPIHYGWKE